MRREDLFTSASVFLGAVAAILLSSTVWGEAVLRLGAACFAAAGSATGGSAEAELRPLLLARDALLGLLARVLAAALIVGLLGALLRRRLVGEAGDSAAPWPRAAARLVPPLLFAAALALMVPAWLAMLRLPPLSLAREVTGLAHKLLGLAALALLAGGALELLLDLRLGARGRGAGL